MAAAKGPSSPGEIISPHSMLAQYVIRSPATTPKLDFDDDTEQLRINSPLYEPTAMKKKKQEREKRCCRRRAETADSVLQYRTTRSHARKSKVHQELHSSSFSSNGRRAAGQRMPLRRGEPHIHKGFSGSSQRPSVPSPETRSRAKKEFENRTKVWPTKRESKESKERIRRPRRGTVRVDPRELRRDRERRRILFKEALRLSSNGKWANESRELRPDSNNCSDTFDSGDDHLNEKENRYPSYRSVQPTTKKTIKTRQYVTNNACRRYDENRREELSSILETEAEAFRSRMARRNRNVENVTKQQRN